MLTHSVILRSERIFKNLPHGRIDLIYMGVLSLNSVKPAELANEGKL